MFASAMKLREYLLLTILLSIISGGIYANDPALFKVEQFDNRTGLSNSAINNLFIDKDALLWAGTWDGLNYYDGYSFQHINYARPDMRSGISNNVVQHIQQDNRNNIWVTTIGGISRYDKNTGLIYNYFYSVVPTESISEHEYGVAIDSKNNTVYAYAAKQGMLQYSFSGQRFSKLSLPVNCGTLVKMLIDEDHLYLLNTENKFYNFKIQGNRLALSQTLNKINNFFVANHRLFITQPDKTLAVYDDAILSKKIIVPDHINAIAYYNNYYLLAWREKGFASYDPTLRPSSYMNDVNKECGEIKITSFSNNTYGSLWIGTDGNGILKVTPGLQTFGTVNFENLSIRYNAPVRSFCKNGNDLWVATKGRGIIVLKNFKEAPASFDKHYTTFSYPAQLDNNAVYALKGSNYNSLIYIGSDAAGLGIYNKKNNRFYKWQDVAGTKNVAAFGSVYSIYEDADSSLWLGTSGYGMVHLKFNVGSNGISISLFEKYTATGNAEGPVNNIIYSIASCGEDYLWVGCRYGGLNLFDKQKKVFKELNPASGNNALSNNDVLYVYNDAQNNLWVGTSYGLNLLQKAQTLKENAGITIFTTDNGLPNNTIHGITEDVNHNIWVSTNKGIAKIMQQGKSIITYQESDGLQSSEFSDGSVWKDINNRLFFGGIAGFNNFDPATIRQDTYLPNLLISNVSIGGVADNINKLPVITKNDQSASDLLSQTLERKSNYFEFSLKTINYNNAAKCEISYYLDGYDKSWHTDKGITKIAYSNLPVGNYKLKIKWSNGTGIWSAEQIILNLKVKQYWWLTSLALLVYGAIILAIAYIIYKYRRDSIEEKHKLEKEKIQRAKEDEIHQNRIGFFTNIAHELQTPLTLVMGSFERILEKGSTTESRLADKNIFYKNLIQQQTAKLTYLLQQLFEFRKIETPYYQANFSYINITALLKNLSEPFVTIGESRKLNYSYQIEENIRGGIDKDKVEKIVFNLLSNAFKYTPDHESILVEANKAGQMLCISVYNSGTTFTDEEVQKLFDLFYTSNDKKNTAAKFGTGIGLAFTKQLTGLMGGEIKVFNKRDGVCFEVYLPIKDVGAEHIVPEGHNPSYLYNILTDPDKQFHYTPIASINKHTIINTIIEDEKDSIVIVEDEKEIRYLLRDILKDSYHIYEAESGAEGLNLVHQHTPALVISDVIMANMDGLELCNIIKNTNAICHIPVVLLSAKSTDEQQLEGYDAGADAYISKPFNSKHLLLRVKKLIEYRKKVNAVIKENTPGSNIKSLGLENEDEEFLSKVYGIIQENIINPELNAQLLEKQLCISRMQLYRKLKSLSDMTPNEFIKNTRLTAAAQLLQTTRLTVADIFYQTGFNNQSYFFREFKKKYSLAPNEYREQFFKKA